MTFTSDLDLDNVKLKKLVESHLVQKLLFGSTHRLLCLDH